VLQAFHRLPYACLQVAALSPPAAEHSPAASPAAAGITHPFGPLHGQNQGFSPLGLAAQAGYGGAAVPFMQVNVNLIQPPYPPRPLALHPPPSFDWAAGPAANVAATGRDPGAGAAAQQRDSAAGLSALAAGDVPPHVMPGSAVHLGVGSQGQDTAPPPAAPPNWRRTGKEGGSHDGPPRLASDGRAAQQPGGHAAAATDAPALPPYASHDAREQPQDEGLALSPPVAGPGQGHHGNFQSWSAQFPIAAAFTQLVSPAVAAAAHSMSQTYPQVSFWSLVDGLSLHAHGLMRSCFLAVCI